MTNPDDPAFPGSIESEYNDPQAGDYTLRQVLRNAGLTKREYFAAMAMQGMLIVGKGLALGITYVDIAKASLETADALIAELNKHEKV